MGYPVTYVRWLAGGDKPRDEKDMVVQHFPSVSEFGRSAILWDKQHGATEAYVIHGSAWEQYLEQMQNGQKLARLARSPLQESRDWL